jgi:hypothetical protein
MRHSFTRSGPGRPLLLISPAGFLGICHKTRQERKEEEDMGMNNFPSLSL